MKKFIIINGKSILFIKSESLKSARHHAINVCDHSHEIIIREFEAVRGYVNKNITDIRTSIRILRDADSHVCGAEAEVGGECTCNNYDLVIDDLNLIF